jgi:hypothetical protein
MAEKNLCNRRITPVKVHLFLESSGDELIYILFFNVT